MGLSTSGTRMRRRFAFLALALGLLLAIVGLELLARSRYRAPWYERLEIAQKTRPTRQGLNPYGLRGPAHAEPKLPTSRRVLFVGDSFTYGGGVEDDALVFPALLERELDDGPRADGVQRIEVLNGGLPGSHTGDWLDLWGRVGAAFDPDVVVVVFFLRDGARLSARSSFFGPIRRGIVERNQRSKLYEYSYVFRMLRDHFDQATVARTYSERIVRAYFGDESEVVEWRAAQANLRELRELALARGATFGLVVFPILVELNSNYPFRSVCELLVAFGERNAMPTLDLLPAFLGHDAPELWVAPMNQHPNTAGHAIAARAMLPFVRGLVEEHERERR